MHLNSMFNIINSNNPRRDPAYFQVPYFRLKSTDKTLSYKGPSLYNNLVNKLNKNLPSDVPRIQNKFMNPFKSVLTKHLLQLQGEGDETWNDQNFILFI